ncbi:MAG: SMC-Scp complex subunit ScpB [Lachnospiraceae bacterium]|nr:SMC-Scp complex subunit ScpB [Lachnospiraceae bacterium]
MVDQKEIFGQEADYSDEERLKGALEAILFTTGEAESASELAKALGVGEEAVHRTAELLAAEYQQAGRGISLIRLENSWQMCTSKVFYPALISYELTPKKPKLTEVQMETLSVIAYRQPVTKSEIERIRGVNSDHAVNKLIEFNLVTELGRAKTPGRPALFGTTDEFLRAFDVSSKDDLPAINPVKLEDFREEAEKEAEKIGV